MTLVIILGPAQQVTVIEDSAPAYRLAQQINLGRWAPDFLASQPTSKKSEPGLNGNYFARQVGEYVVVSEILAAAPGTGGLVENGAPPPAAIRLSPREYQVLICLANGATFLQTAATLHIKERTVRGHVANMKTRLKAQNVTHLVGQAILMGFLNKEIDLNPGKAARPGPSVSSRRGL